MGRKFKLRNELTFIRNNKGTNEKIVDEDDPAFKGQEHKFHPEPVSEAIAAQTAAVQSNANIEAELARIAEMKREELHALVLKVAGKKAPDEANAGQLRQMLAEVAGGTSPAEAFDEAFGPAPSAPPPAPTPTPPLATSGPVKK